VRAKVAEAESVCSGIQKQVNREYAAKNTDFENVEKEKDANVLRDNLDDTLMHAKALKAGTKALKNQSISELKYTSLDNTNTTQVLAQAFAGFNAVNNGIKM